ncbi:MAG TPA: hypothetical protein VLY24_03675 [Bryobacteraceae bacterium]|nr:hypothetical protein [Bryobacteraceae bacterium]
MYLLVAACACACALADDGPVVPLTVCEILHDLASYEGKSEAVLGRYSFRQDGSWLGEQTCDASSTAPFALFLAEDPKDGPRPPDTFQLDGPALTRKLAEIRKHTSLGKFRFGSTDYDRWAVVFGRVENRKEAAAKKAAADLVFRGDGVVVFINNQ